MSTKPPKNVEKCLKMCRKMSEKCPKIENTIFGHFWDNFCLFGRCFCLVTLSNARPVQPLKLDRISSSTPDQKMLSAPEGRQQMGETGFCKNLRFSAVSCENLRFPVVFYANLRLPNPLIYRASRKSAKICENVRSGSGFSLLLSPFWRALRRCSGCHGVDF